MNSGFVERNLGEVYGKNLLLYGQNANMRIEETELEYLEADCEKQSHSDNMKMDKTNREGREDCE